MAIEDRIAAHTALRDKQAFNEWTDIQTRHLDVDMMSHVNHAVMATYFELSRMTVMKHLVGRDDSGFMLGDLHIRYLAEVNITDQVRVGTRLAQVGTSSFTMGQGMFINNEQVTDLCTTTCLSTLVHVDRATRKPAPLPEMFLKVLEGFV